MAGRQAIAIATLALIIAACGAGAEPPPSPTAAADPTASPEAVVVVVEPTAEPVTPSPSPTPTPQPTPAPVPPKPTGIELSYPCVLDCRADDDQGFGITWKAPRTKGTEIRVYGVTTCFRTDAPDGKCLRKHTALPEDVRVLLAKGPASKGRLSLPLYISGVEPSDGWCAQVYPIWEGKRVGVPVYSIVIAAYDANGHSIFAIANPGRYYAGECIPDTY